MPGIAAASSQGYYYNNPETLSFLFGVSIGATLSNAEFRETDSKSITDYGILTDTMKDKMALDALRDQLSSVCKIDGFHAIADYCLERPVLRSRLTDVLNKAVAFMDPDRNLVRRVSLYEDPEVEDSYIDFRFELGEYDLRFEKSIDSFYLGNSQLLDGLDGWIQIGTTFA